MKSLNNLVKDVADRIPKDEIDDYQKKWARLTDYVWQEQALHGLFSVRQANFLSQDDLMIKCATLNDFYSTNIFKIYHVVRHYLTVRDLEKRISSGDLSLVEDLRKVSVPGQNDNTKYWDYYSFATKFCSHHNPEAFPIYDKYAVRMLCAFGRHAKLGFTLNKMDNYQEYDSAIKKFRQHYGLLKYTLKEIDRYLWLLGKELS